MAMTSMSDLDQEMDGLRAEFAGLKADLRTFYRRVMFVNIASMFGCAGLVLAAARLA
jgi:hypothetical protein